MKRNIGPRLDEKDYLVLKLLLVDSMVSLKDVSKQVGLSTPAVSARIRKLKETGLFDPTIHIAYEKLGLKRYNLGLTLRTGIPPDSRSRVIERFIGEPAVLSIWATSGEHDLVVQAVFGSSHELIDFVDRKVRPITEISSMEICEMLEAIKRDCKDLRTEAVNDMPLPFSSRQTRR